MDETELEINKIMDLKMVHIYELAGTGNSADCTAMAVYYGSDGKLNLSDFDEHFEKLVNHVFSLYNQLEDKSSVMMDDTTRALMDAGINIRREKDYEFFYGIKPLDVPKIPKESMLIKRFLPLAEYLVVGLNKVVDIKLDVINLNYGWRGLGSMKVSDGIAERLMSVNVKPINSRKYSITVSDIFENHVALYIDVFISYSDMNISFKTTDGLFYGKGSYTFGYDKMTETYEAFYKDKQIFFDSENKGVREVQSLLELSDGELKLIMSSKNIRAVYELPWKSKYILADDYNQEEAVEVYSMLAMYLYDDYIDEYGWTDILNKAGNIRLRTETVQLSRMKLADETIQTFFEPVENNNTGAYKEALAGKYFLHKYN